MPNSFLSLKENDQAKAMDKWTAYLAAYQRLFAPYRNNKIRLLEIGVQNGGSLELWSRYFRRAQLILGCDIDPAIAALDYDDPAVNLIVGDVTQNDTFQAISLQHAPFNIIIDDGSHQSVDVIKTFLMYYPLLKPGGLYVIEDLHCAYWPVDGGGIGNPDSAMSFFKLLVDYLNREAWGAYENDPAAFLRDNGFDVSTAAAQAIDYIDRIEFSPSLCAIHKAKYAATVGKRIVSGHDFAVNPAPQSMQGQSLRVPETGENNPPQPGKAHHAADGSADDVN